MSDLDAIERAANLLSALEMAGREDTKARRKAIHKQVKANRKASRRGWFHRLTVKTNGVDWPAESIDPWPEASVDARWSVPIYDVRM